MSKIAEKPTNKMNSESLTIALANNRVLEELKLNSDITNIERTDLFSRLKDDADAQKTY